MEIIIKGLRKSVVDFDRIATVFRSHNCEIATEKRS